MITDDLQDLGENKGQITVSLSNELVQLLSDQLYSTALKAIEELVVNSYDANSKYCAVFVPNLFGVFNEQNKIVVLMMVMGWMWKDLLICGKLEEAIKEKKKSRKDQRENKLANLELVN
ncbi:MAG: hypothetical protein IPK76_14940 [Lewinellaceae bacterium]|nr:hypothetical protein [Lewinellaceae bacterium]